MSKDKIINNRRYYFHNLDNYKKEVWKFLVSGFSCAIVVFANTTSIIIDNDVIVCTAEQTQFSKLMPKDVPCKIKNIEKKEVLRGFVRDCFICVRTLITTLLSTARNKLCPQNLCQKTFLKFNLQLFNCY